jgi:hypothetical protein
MCKAWSRSMLPGGSTVTSSRSVRSRSGSRTACAAACAQATAWDEKSPGTPNSTRSPEKSSGAPATRCSTTTRSLPERAVRHRDKRTEAVRAVKTAALRPPTPRPSARTCPGAKTPNGRGPLGYRVHLVAPGVMTPCLVVLTGTPSHSRDAIAALAGRRTESGGRALGVRQRQVRLPHADVVRLVMQYEAGARTTDLAKQFGVHRNTVQRLLRRKGVLLRCGTRPVDEFARGC